MNEYSLPSIYASPVVILYLVHVKECVCAIHYIDVNPTPFFSCWLKNDVAFYVAVVAYFCVVFQVNLTMFIVVIVQLYRIKRQNPHNAQHRSTLQNVRSVVGLTILLGLTWGFAFFAWGPVNLAFMYLFSIFNSLQGETSLSLHAFCKVTYSSS